MGNAANLHDRAGVRQFAKRSSTSRRRYECMITKQKEEESMENLPKSGFTVSQTEYFPEINMPLRLTYPRKSSARFHPIHFHDFTEIGIVISGEARHLIRKGTQQLQQGDIILVPRGANHGFAYMQDFGILNLLFIQRRLPLPLLDFGNGKFARKIFSVPSGNVVSVLYVVL